MAWRKAEKRERIFKEKPEELPILVAFFRFLTCYAEFSLKEILGVLENLASFFCCPVPTFSVSPTVRVFW